METVLNYSPETKSCWLTNELFYQDSPGAFNNITPSEVPFNEGMALRRQIKQTCHSFDVMFKPHIEVFNQSRMLLPCDIRLKFGRNV